jgi:exodeoxyribonuclease VII small subunit
VTGKAAKTLGREHLPMAADAANDIASLSFEAALAELEGIVARLESGQASLEDSIGLYERGAALKAHCEERLRQAQMRVEQIVETPSGLAVEPARLGQS